MLVSKQLCLYPALNVMLSLIKLLKNDFNYDKIEGSFISALPFDKLLWNIVISIKQLQLKCYTVIKKHKIIISLDNLNH